MLAQTLAMHFGLPILQNRFAPHWFKQNIVALSSGFWPHLLTTRSAVVEPAVACVFVASGVLVLVVIASGVLVVVVTGVLVVVATGVLVVVIVASLVGSPAQGRGDFGWSAHVSDSPRLKHTSLFDST